MRLVGMAPVLCVALLAGCSASEKPGTDSASSHATDLNERHVADLGDVIVSEAPDGYEPAPDDFPAGPFDRARYLETFSNRSTDGALLDDCQLVRGYNRLWIPRRAGPALAIFVFECASEQRAERLHDGFRSGDLSADNSESFSVEGIEGATGVSYDENIEGGTGRVQVVGFVRGPRVFAVAAQYDRGDGPTGPVLALAAAEIAVAR